MDASRRWSLFAMMLAVLWIVVYWAYPGAEANEPARVAEGVSGAPLEGNDQPSSPSGRAIEMGAPIGTDASRDLARTGDSAADDEPTPVSPTDSDDSDVPGVIPPTWVEHTVARGERLEDIAQQYFGDRTRWPAIARMNPDTLEPNRLRIGQVIRIPTDPANVQGLAIDGEGNAVRPEPAPPPATFYIVREGDTLSEIAARVYGRSSLWTLIRDANPGTINRRGTNIRPGMELVLPQAPAE